MSEIAIGETRASETGAFTRRTMLLIVGIGVIAFCAMLVLGAYAPDLRSGKNGGGHALSNASVGFSGIVRLAEATGHHPEIIRSESMLDSENLAIITPESAGTDLTKILETRGARSNPDRPSEMVDDARQEKAGLGQYHGADVPRRPAGRARPGI